MNRNEQQMYSDITSIRESLEKIAKALDTPNVVYNGELKNTKDIPGFEGVLNDLDNYINQLLVILTLQVMKMKKLVMMYTMTS